MRQPPAALRCLLISLRCHHHLHHLCLSYTRTPTPHPHSCTCTPAPHSSPNHHGQEDRYDTRTLSPSSASYDATPTCPLAISSDVLQLFTASSALPRLHSRPSLTHRFDSPPPSAASSALRASRCLLSPPACAESEPSRCERELVCSGCLARLRRGFGRDGFNAQSPARRFAPPSSSAFPPPPPFTRSFFSSPPHLLSAALCCALFRGEGPRGQGCQARRRCQDRQGCCS